MEQMNQAFRNIVNVLHGVRDGLVRTRQQLRATRASIATSPGQLAINMSGALSQ